MASFSCHGCRSSLQSHMCVVGVALGPIINSFIGSEPPKIYLMLGTSQCAATPLFIMITCMFPRTPHLHACGRGWFGGLTRATPPADIQLLTRTRTNSAQPRFPVIHSCNSLSSIRAISSHPFVQPRDPFPQFPVIQPNVHLRTPPRSFHAPPGPGP